MQLDIFEHSRDVVLRNAACDALRRRDCAAAASAIARLAAEFGGDPLLPAMRVLCEAFSQPAPAALDHAGAGNALRVAETALVPAAQQVFGKDAAAVLAPLWRELAAAMAALPFQAGAEAVHRVPLLLRAGDWQAAAAAIDAIPSWRRQPAPLAWKFEAVCRSEGFPAAWPLFAELAWMAPARAAACETGPAAAELSPWLRRFDAEFDDAGGSDDIAWFPAWAAIVAKDLAAGLTLAQAGNNKPPERCARLVQNLLALERQGRHAELIDARKKLRHAQPELFARYMQTR